MTQVQSAAEAVRLADELIRPYYPFRQLQTAKRILNIWIVNFDVGAVKQRIVRVRINAATGQIIDIDKGTSL
ncbi:MAG: hypothetical protein Q8O40_13865 [Chloroflexota bacterium]|nr:hypothetical protein [Chloroflexota bacterium]